MEIQWPGHSRRNKLDIDLVKSPIQSAGYYNAEVNNAFGTTNSAKFFLNVSQVLVAGAPFTDNMNTPVGISNVIAVAAGGSHIVALRSDGTVRTWLANANFIDAYAFSVTNVPASMTNVIALAAGRDHCLALRSNGTVVAWGGNSFGQTNTPLGQEALTNVTSIAAGSYRSYAVKADGTVRGWGSQPAVPAGLSNVVAMAAGPSQNLALKRDGTVTAWGSGPLAAVPTGLSNVIAIAAGSVANRALRQDGTVVTWSSSSGFITETEPVGIRQTIPLTNAVAIAVGSGVSMTLKQDGMLRSPELEIIGLTVSNNIIAIAAGGVQSGFGVMLTGNGSPAITLHPHPQVVQRSNTVQFHSRAAGVQPMRYQWFLDQLPLPGATNASIIITNAQGRDAGGYRLLVSNALGSVFSATAQLTIPFGTNLPAALNATNLTWTTGLSNTAWFAQIRETHDGNVAAQSGAISHNQQSQLSANVSGPGTVSFWWKASSEAGYDFLKFSMDNETAPRASISGETDWEQRTFSIPSGSHVLRWVYAKDGTVSSGRDAGWLDEVVFVPAPTLLRHPYDQTAPFGVNVTFPAFAGGPSPVSFQWLKYGDVLTGATNQYLTLNQRGPARLGSLCAARFQRRRERHQQQRPPEGARAATNPAPPTIRRRQRVAVFS